MPAQLSKLIDAACTDYSHPWNDSCIGASAALGFDAFLESLRIYSTVYVVALLMRGRLPARGDIKKTVLGIMRSTVFLSWNGAAFSLFICLLRRMLGHFNVLSVSFLPSFLSSITAIFIERASRRTLLTLYVSNIASETLFRMGVSRGYWYPVPYAETYIFALSMAVLLYYYRTKTEKPDPIYKILRIIVGKYEDASIVDNPDCIKSEQENRSAQRKDLNIFRKSLEAYRELVDKIRAKGKQVCCPHPFSCTHYVSKGGVQLFSYALGGQLAINIVLGARRLINRPALLKSTIFKKGNLSLPMFIGGFAALYRLVSCSLRRSFRKDSPYFAMPAALAGGLAFTAYKSNTISLYFMWKALHILWNDLADKKLVPEVKWFAVILYSFCTAVLFHAAIVEPQNLRPSYWKFLHNISGGRISAMSRIPINEFGLETSKHLADVLKATNTTNKWNFRS